VVVTGEPDVVGSGGGVEAVGSPPPPQAATATSRATGIRAGRRMSVLSRIFDLARDSDIRLAGSSPVGHSRVTALDRVTLDAVWCPP
jgi:hypothetical protein